METCSCLVGTFNREDSDVRIEQGGEGRRRAALWIPAFAGMTEGLVAYNCLE